MSFTEKKLFFDASQEEKYLNDMAQKGFKFLQKKSPMRYVFEESETTERYCIDYLPGLSFQKKSMEYLNFLQENNVNVIHQGVTKLIVSVP